MGGIAVSQIATPIPFPLQHIQILSRLLFVSMSVAFANKLTSVQFMCNSTKKIFMSQQCIITMQVTVSVGSRNNSALFQYIHKEHTYKLGMPHLIHFSPPKCVHVCRPPRFTFSTTSQSFMRNVCMFRQCQHHLAQETTQVRTSFNSAPAC